MIPYDDVTAWGVDRLWSTREQVEQDLLLSRAICAIATHPYLGEELVLRGGTAFHKLALPRPLRYSEDLDYVRSTAGGIRDLTAPLTELGESLGFEVRTRVGAYPKVLWRTVAQTGVPLRIKIEINTYERSPALPPQLRPYAVSSRWWSGQARVRMFATEELVATKIRALYQRAKGRDLFDLWLALDTLELSPTAILATFGPYQPAGLSAALAVTNLEAKLRDRAFRTDLVPLIVDPGTYDIDVAGARVIHDLLAHLPVATHVPEGT